MLVYFRF